jgi:prepilin signal peptidase PulO-like enzyme (type II secretory pathway)
MNWYLTLMIFCFGVSVGSFLNMLIYRTEVDYGLRKTKGNRNSNRSFCDFCGSDLEWYDNVPVFSWLMLGGMSRCCHKKLPYTYPLLELFVGMIFVLATNLLRPDPLFLLVGLVMISLMIFSAVFDIKWMILPDFSTFMMLGMAVVVWILSRLWQWEYLLAAIASWGFMMLLYLVTRGKGMGMGDVKYVLFMGLILGGVRTIIAFYIAFVSGAIVGVGLLALKKSKRSGKMPFGPFLIGATALSWLIGDKIWLYVYNWF